MNYQEIYEKMYDAIREGHSARWGGTLEEIQETELAIRKLRDEFGVEVYSQALEDYNKVLSQM